MTEPQPDESGDLSQVDPDDYARLVGQVSDKELAEGMAANRELILSEVFRQMPARLRRDVPRDMDVVVEWNIGGAPGEASERWQVTIRDGDCRVQRDGTDDANVTFTVGAVDFIKLVTGHAKGPLLFLTGRLKIKGDVLQAARYQSYFTLPGAAS